MRPSLRRRTTIVLATVMLGMSAVASATPSGHVVKTRSQVLGTDGKSYSITNHLTRAAFTPGPREWLLTWAGDDEAGVPGTPDPDFIAVIDATAGSRDYGKVVNTVTIDSIFGNEPHHMQYVWHRGDRVFAGGLLSDTTYVFDVSQLPQVRLAGITLGRDTPCGSAPDAYAVLEDGTALATYMGGPDVAGPCRYTDGEVRTGNGYAGSPGEIVHIGRDGKVISESPAASRTAEDAKLCLNIPALPQATCANPHGIAVREDLGRAVASDFAEVRNMVTPPAPPPANVGRQTVRIFDITGDGGPKLKSISQLPMGPRQEPDPLGIGKEPYMVMETAVTNKRHHRGAFASTMSGGAIFYTPDITDPKPRWREVYDDYSAFKSLFPQDTPHAGTDGGSWLMVSPDDRFLYHVVLKGGVTSPEKNKNNGMVYVLDIQKLLAAGNDTKCSVDTLAEVSTGGQEPDCPSLVSALPITDLTSGGPHWAAMDNFKLGPGGKHGRKYEETSEIRRIAVSNYFVKATYSDGDHRVCMISLSKRGELSLDTRFRDENTGDTCVAFNRTKWPHGERGGARPHGVLFAVADAHVR